MFTGIVETMAQVHEKSGSHLVLERPKSFTDIRRGSSIAVAGVCLTVVKLTKSNMTFDMVPETLKRTTLKSLKVGDRVNLERALLISRVIQPAGRSFSEGWSSPAHAGRIEGRFEGHIVLGHVDGVGQVRKVGRFLRATLSRSRGTGESRSIILTISYPPNLKNLLVPKGSIAIDGVSLTIASLDDKTFSVALIPHTLAETTLGDLQEGDSVNLEADILAKYAAHSP